MSRECGATKTLVGASSNLINQQVVTYSLRLSPSTSSAKFEKKCSFTFVCLNGFADAKIKTVRTNKTLIIRLREQHEEDMLIAARKCCFFHLLGKIPINSLAKCSRINARSYQTSLDFPNHSTNNSAICMIHSH